MHWADEQDREKVLRITAADVRNDMARHWTIYHCCKRQALHIDFNGLGELRVVKDRKTLWQGKDLDEAIARLKDAV